MSRGHCSRRHRSHCACCFESKCDSPHVWHHQPLRWCFRGTESECDSISSVVHRDLIPSSLLVVRLYDTVNAIKVHKVNIRSSNNVSLLKHCIRVGYPTLLVNAISYSPQ